LSDEVQNNPYPTYEWLREEAPIYFHEGMRSWVISRHSDCLRVLRDHTVFASDARRADDAAVSDNPSLQGLDPPQHTPLRQLFRALLTDLDFIAVERRAFEISAGQVAGAAEAGLGYDFVADVARPAALAVMSELIGVRPPDVVEFSHLVDAIERGMDAGLVPEAATGAGEAREGFARLIDGWRTAHEPRGFVARLLRADVGDQVTDTSVWNSLRVFFLAGYSSTAAAAANSALVLAAEPRLQEQAADALAQEGGATTCVDELMRYESPIQAAGRSVVADTELHGVTMRRGDSVVVLIGAANRDPARFAEPDRVRLHRPRGQHLAFGWGVHACTGTLIAKAAVAGILRGLLSSGSFRIDGQMHRQRRATVRYPAVLPLRHERDDRLPSGLVPVGGGAAEMREEDGRA